MPKPSQDEARAPLTLEELLELLMAAGRIAPERAKEIAGRATTLRSQVLKERVGSVRSQAAARYEASPAELVATARLQDASQPKRALDEDVIAEALAARADVPYLKIDPVRVNADLVTSTLSRPFARRHAVIPVAKEGDTLTIALTDPFDGTLRESLESLLRVPLTYVVASKRDIVAIIDRVFGFRSSVTRAQEQLGPSSSAQTALAQLVQLRSNDELAGNQDEHVIAAVDYLLNYAFDQRASDIHLEPRDREGAIRFRIDGILHEIERLPLAVHAAVVSRIKVLARMDIAERRAPRTAASRRCAATSEVELRVSTLPRPSARRS